MDRPARFAALAFALLLALSGLPAVAASEDARAQFQAAMARPDSPETVDPESLRRYPLYPYLEAARLRAALGSAPGAATDARVAGFLARHQGEPVAVGLRTAWLLNLAERRAWTRYLEQLPEPPDDDLLRCHWLDAQLSLGNQAALQAHALDTWLTGHDMPKACNAVFGWLDQQGVLTPARIEQRIAAALDAGEPALVRYLARALPAARARPLVNAALLQETPAPMLDRLTDAPDAPVDWRWIAQAFDRLARADSSRAISRIEPLIERRQPSAAQQGGLIRSLALGLAYDRDPRALSWFDRVPETERDEQTREWHVRAALYAGDWPRVRTLIEQMPPDLAQQPRWRYWRARALAATGAPEAAAAAYRALSTERDPYGFYAAARIGVSPDLAPRALSVDESAQRQLLALAGVQRALELRAVELYDEAVAELYWAIDDLDPQGRLQAALLLNRRGWYAASIALMAEAGRWDDLVARFPLPFRERVDEAADSVGLPAEWIYAVMRAESLYEPTARSGAGAYGLLQLLPGTAREVARRNGLPPPSRRDLFEPPVNIALGSRYLAELDARFDGHFLLVIAAYNAGPYRIPDWLPPHEMDADIWIENIPYNETRGYVSRVLYNSVIFGWRLRGEPAAVTPLLRPVPARLG